MSHERTQKEKDVPRSGIPAKTSGIVPVKKLSNTLKTPVKVGKNKKCEQAFFPLYKKKKGVRGRITHEGLATLLCWASSFG